MLQDKNYTLERIKEIDSAVGIFRQYTSANGNLPGVKISHRVSRLFDGIEKSVEKINTNLQGLMTKHALSLNPKLGIFEELDISKLGKEKEGEVLSEFKKKKLIERKEAFLDAQKEYLGTEDTVKVWSKPANIEDFGDLKLPYDFFRLMGDLVQQDDSD